MKSLQEPSMIGYNNKVVFIQKREKLWDIYTQSKPLEQ